jgi:branched-chain amino acid transport system substrate-binding protein
LGHTLGTGAGTTVVLSAMALLAAGCATSSDQPVRETVVIAADLELSGDGSALGAIYRNALDLRVEQVNRQGLLRDRQLELVVRDNRTDSATSASNLTDLAADPSVAAIITGACAPCLVAGADTVNTVGVPTISLAAADSVSEAAEERPYLFKLGPNPKDTASALVLELDRAEVRTVAVITTDDDYGDDGLEAIGARVGRPGIEVVIDAQLSPDSDGLDALAAEIAGYAPEPVFGVPPAPPRGPDAVVVWGLAPFAGDVATSLRAAGYENPLYLDPGAADELFLAGPVGNALAGSTMIFTETMVIDEVIATSPAKAARKTWFNDYSARYGTYHGFASFAADAVLLVVEAINRAGGTDRAAIRAALESLQLDGLSGPLRMTPENHSGLLPQALATLVARGDRWRLAS